MRKADTPLQGHILRHLTLFPVYPQVIHHPHRPLHQIATTTIIIK
jgi:hypothetical protein